MPQIPLATYAYRRGDGLFPSIRLQNVYAEKSPTDLKTGSALLTRPNLETFATVGSGPIRCVFWEDDVFDDDALVVSGTSLYRVSEAGAATLLGTVPGTGAVEIAASPTKAMIANGDALLSTDGATVSAEAFPDSQDIQSVAYINGYFLAVPVDSHRIYYWTLLTGEFDDATRFISAERYPDNIVKIVVTSDEVWAMGSGSVEVFVPTGIDTDENPPFQRVEARLYKKGVLNPRTVVEADNTLYWVGQSKDAGLAVYRGEDVPKAVSNDSISERLTRADPDDLKAWVFGTANHSFYVLAMGAEGTWVYDISTGSWTEWTSFGREQWRAHIGRGCWPGVVLAGDDEDGTLWRLSDTGTTDNGDPIIQVWTAGAPVDRRAINQNVTLECAVGQGAGTILLNVSDDQGRTWDPMGAERLAEGQYGARVRWTRLGQMQPPVRIYEWSASDPLRMRISGARVNDAL